MLESTVRSSARTEKRGAYRARTATIGRAINTPSSAPAPPQQKGFGQQRPAQRAGGCAERGADRQLAFTPNGSRENQVGDVRARDDEDQRRRREQRQQHSPRARRDLVAQPHGVNAEVRFR
jgi:hypothetical protein